MLPWSSVIRKFFTGEQMAVLHIRAKSNKAAKSQQHGNSSVNRQFLTASINILAN